MKFRKRRPTAAAASPDDDDQLPIPGYSQLKGKQISDQLSQLSQVELATVETYERAHGNRSAVLEKLRYMRGNEPLPGYDELTPEEIAAALAGANAKTVRAVRDYERKFQRRRAVLDEAARVLPTSQASADEKQASEAKASLLREGYADRERTTPPPPE
jgi:hypothetical protein